MAEEASQDIQRRLAAILSADAVGYSRLMGDDDVATVRTLSASRAIIAEVIASTNGRVVDAPGDNILAEFGSAVDAVNAACTIQERLSVTNAGLPEHRRMAFRIGVNLGDVLVEEGRLYGDGVNIAARLESQAEAGSVMISSSVYDQVHGKVAFEFVDRGKLELKNIPDPVHAYSLETGRPVQGKLPTARTIPKRRRMFAALGAGVVALVIAGGAWYFLLANRTVPAEAAHLSIVVLPFSNLSGDLSQDYVADVLTDQLTTYIARIPGSFVIASTTAFTYKGKSTDAKQIGKELGVRYALEGSVQPDSNRVRVNAELLDAESGAHLWAEEFNHDRGDLPQTEDEIVTRLARTLQINPTDVKAARVERVHPANQDAQELALRCQAAYLNFGPVGDQAEAGFGLCEQALGIDPNNEVALSILAIKFESRVTSAQTSDRQVDVAKVGELASHALAIDPNSPDAHVAKGGYFLVAKRFDDAKGEYQRAIALNPSQMNAYSGLCLAYLDTGQFDEVIICVEKAVHLSPSDSRRSSWLLLEGLADLGLRRDDQALEMLRRATAAGPSVQFGQAALAAALALAGHDAEAKEALRRYLALPDTRSKSIAALKKQVDSDNAGWRAMRERLYEGLHKAGMAEDDAPSASPAEPAARDKPSEPAVVDKPVEPDVADKPARVPSR